MVHSLINLFQHLDEYLLMFIANYNTWVYLVLFLIIFLETGFLFAALLPGDSLLFATGAMAAREPLSLNIHWLVVLLFLAAIMGNCANYFFGKWLGPKVFRSKNTWFFNKANMEKSHAAYKKSGGKIIIISCFIPIIRTFAPFIAGMVRMSGLRFFLYNVVGALLWVSILLYSSYFFDNIEIVKQHFTLVMFGIVLLFLLPPVVTLYRRQT